MKNVYSPSKVRVENLQKLFEENFNAKEKHLFSSPGRIEIIGNHTDHNNGRVVAAAINLDTLAVVSKTDDLNVQFISTNLNQKFELNLKNLSLSHEEKGQATSLIRGIGAKFVANGHNIGGFECVVQSEVAIGSGLSSSASIEILIGSILNYFYNDNSLSPIELAKIGQYAENVYFGKPCGLMDQLAISNGGIIGIDFMDFENPEVTYIHSDLSPHNHSFVIVNTGGSHTVLTDDYAAIPKEMKAIANHFDQKSLRFVDRNEFNNNVPDLRAKYGDRAILRALHFFQEDQRAQDTVKILNEGDFNGFLKLINEAGNSSIKWLQNAFSAHDVHHQGINLAIELTEQFFETHGIFGAVKVHGGGFAGTILTVISNDLINKYISEMDCVFGNNSSTKISIRDIGTSHISIL